MAETRDCDLAHAVPAVRRRVPRGKCF